LFDSKKNINDEVLFQCMIYELSEIKNLRKKLGLSQNQLAHLAGVSQSMIAKVEAGRLDPAFSKAMKIFTALQNISHAKELKATDIMNKKIISLKQTDDVKDAVSKMRKHEISQLPVIEGTNVVGIVSEAVLLDAALNNKSAHDVGDLMTDAPPIVSEDATLTVVSNLLKYFPVVLVSSRGKFKGLITKADVLGRMV
jgi:predicted transcriptional regulator